MEVKLKGWKEGILSKELIGFNGNVIHTKGSTVRYKRTRTRDVGHKFTDYEWWYLDTNNYNLIRTTELTIEGQPYIKEPINR